jgi:hypothetical protein
MAGGRLANRPPIESIDSELGVVTTSPDPKGFIRSIDDWLAAYPELAKIPKIAKSVQMIRRAASKQLDARSCTRSARAESNDTPGAGN